MLRRPRRRRPERVAQAANRVIMIAGVVALLAGAARAEGVRRCRSHPAPGSRSCAGDCSGDARVTAAEVLSGVQLSGDPDQLDACPAADHGRDGAVGFGDILESVAMVFAGCGHGEAPHKLSCEPGVEMCNLAAAAGLDLPAFGKGAAFVDIDGDGWDDIWSSDSDDRALGVYGVSTLYRNQGDGTFAPFDLGIEDKDLLMNWSASFADYDNDGDADALLMNGGYAGERRLALYRNDLRESGRLTAVTFAAGLTTEVADWWGASWADYDRDGWLDFAVTPAHGRVWLYHNRGDGTFEDVANALGIPNSVVREDTKNPVWFDYELDGDPDLYIAGPLPRLYRNDHPAGFVDVTPLVTYGEVVELPYVFAAASEDFNQDGWPDLYLGRWVFQDYVLLNQGNGTFIQWGRDAGIDKRTGRNDSPLGPADPDWSENTMGLGTGDLDEDGFPDVFIGTGNPSFQYVDIIYCNRSVPGALDGLWFERCSEPVIAGHGAAQTHGIVLGDADNDGDLDVFYNLGGMQQHHGGPASLEFRTPPAFYIREPDGPRHTATLRLEGTLSNRDAVGARIRVQGSETRYYTVQSTQGFQSQNSARIVATLGDRRTGTATINWPSGDACTLGIHAGDRIVIEE